MDEEIPFSCVHRGPIDIYEKNEYGFYRSSYWHYPIPFENWKTTKKNKFFFFQKIKFQNE